MKQHTQTKTIASLALALMLSALPVAAAADTTPADPTGQLGALQGRWSYTERDYKTPYSDANISHGIANCNWSPNRSFLICDYLNSAPKNGVPINDLGIFSYNPTTRTYARLGVFKDRKPFAEHVIISGNAWISSADIPDKQRTLIYRVTDIFSPDRTHVSATTAISADKGHTWTTISSFTEAKTTP